MTDPDFERELKRQIHARGTALMASAPRRPELETRPRSDATVRGQWPVRGGWAAALAALVVLLVIGSRLTPPPGGSPSPSPTGPSATAQVVPWMALSPPSRSPSPVPSSTAPACHAADLTVSALTFAGFAMGSEGFAGTVSAHGGTPCTLPAQPVAAFADANGGALVVRAAGSPSSPPVVLTATSATASVALVLGAWCAVPTLRSTSVALAGGDALRFPIVPFAVSGASPCPGEASYRLSLAAPSTASPVPTAADRLSLALSSSGPAVPGAPYRYLVTITNVGTAVVSLHPCPVYDTGLKSVAGSAVRYQLDCPAARPIDPGGSETFEMYVPIPPSVPAGQYLLNWGIEGSDVVANGLVTIP